MRPIPKPQTVTLNLPRGSMPLKAPSRRSTAISATPSRPAFAMTRKVGSLTPRPTPIPAQAAPTKKRALLPPPDAIPDMDRTLLWEKQDVHNPDTGEMMTVTIPFPQEWTRRFLANADALEYAPRRLREFLAFEHQRIFHAPPDPKTALALVKQRIGYRLQMLGHLITGTEPAHAFLQNYDAIVKNWQPDWEGCPPEKRWIAKRLSMAQGERTMTATAVATAKKRAPASASVTHTAAPMKKLLRPEPAAKVAKKTNGAPTASKPRPKFCGDAALGIREVIIWLARQKRALTRLQIQQAVKKAIGFEPNINTTGECIRPKNLDDKKIEIRMPSEYGQKLLQAARSVVPSI